MIEHDLSRFGHAWHWAEFHATIKVLRWSWQPAKLHSRQFGSSQLAWHYSASSVANSNICDVDDYSAVDSAFRFSSSIVSARRELRCVAGLVTVWPTEIITMLFLPRCLRSAARCSSLTLLRSRSLIVLESGNQGRRRLHLLADAGFRDCKYGNFHSMRLIW